MLGLAARLIGGIFTPLIDQASASSARLLRKLALFLVAAVAMVVVLIALTIAFDLWIATLAGPIVGALAVAGVYLLVAVIAVFLALRRPRQASAQASGARRAQAADPAATSQVDEFAAPLLKLLQSLGLRREQLAVLAGTSVAKQIGPVPLVGLAIIAGFLVGRMWNGWRGIVSSDLVATLMASDLFAGLVGSKTEADTDDERDAA